MDLTDYTEQQFRDWMSQGTQTATPPDPLYVALHSVDPGDAPDGTTEIDAADYGRQSVQAGAGWNTPANNTFENASQITFGEATSNWGQVAYATAWDGSQTTDNALSIYSLDTAKSINSGDEGRFSAGQLSFQFD